MAGKLSKSGNTLQKALEFDLYSEAVKGNINNPKLDNEGSYILPESLTQSIDKYAELHKVLLIIADDLMNVFQDSSNLKK